MIGREGGDSLFGGLSNDILEGGTGADVLDGGEGNDEFRYRAATEAVAGESVDGGAGTDTLRFTGTGVIDLKPVALALLERIVFANTASGAQADFAASQLEAASPIPSRSPAVRRKTS